MIGLSPESENNVLSFLPEIVNRLNPQELTQNTKYLNNPCVCSYLQKLRTLRILFRLSTTSVDDDHLAALFLYAFGGESVDTLHRYRI